MNNVFGMTKSRTPLYSLWSIFYIADHCVNRLKKIMKNFGQQRRILVTMFHIRGPGGSVGIETDYGLDGPRIESRWGEIFRPSRPALSPTQPPVQWVPGLFRR
jgi:hypothetical protein